MHWTTPRRWGCERIVPDSETGLTDRQQAKALAIHDRLVCEYGPRSERHRVQDPLSELIYTILSQNTADVNTRRSSEGLRRRFPTWSAVRDADVQEVEEAIRIGGLARIKAPRIQAILRQITEERGELSLGFLADTPVEEARQWLISLKGVGHKTAACVLLFSLGKPALPVDTHVHRVTRRLGLVPRKASPEKTNHLLEAMIPPALYYPFHMNIITHGRRICKAQRPLCDRCALVDLCDHACDASQEM